MKGYKLEIACVREIGANTAFGLKIEIISLVAKPDYLDFLLASVISYFL